MSHGTIQFPYQFQHALMSHLDFKVCSHSTICFLYVITHGGLGKGSVYLTGRIDPSILCWLHVKGDKKGHRIENLHPKAVCKEI